MSAKDFRRNKIVATVGPASSSRQMLLALMEAGADVFRLNFSHGRHAELAETVALIRELSRDRRRAVAILGDLQGPKIRTGMMRGDVMTLTAGQGVVITTAEVLGGDGVIPTTYEALPQDVKVGERILLDDGLLELQVEKVVGVEVHCRVVVGGELKNRKGINLPGVAVSAPSLTDKDRVDARFALELGVDLLALSFVRRAEDVADLRELVSSSDGDAWIIAKIEKPEALDAIEGILALSDGIMVARGDLGVELPPEAVPIAQAQLVDLARARGKPVIVATQMLESMVEHPRPTRAEVTDVSNAVRSGTDAVMLSAETATGKYPAKAVQAMDRVCKGAERQRVTTTPERRQQMHFNRADEAIAKAAMYTANHLGVKAIAALTESGATPLWMSRVSSGIPIYALTRHVETRRKVTIYRGVYPVSFDVMTTDHAEVNREAIDELMRRGAVRDGDLVIITKGDLAGVLGGTNAMKILRVGDHDKIAQG